MAEPPKQFHSWAADQFGEPVPVEFEGIHAEPERAANRELFVIELEFVQSLSNPHFLYNLAHQGYLDDQAFLNYLKYLQYWQEREYAQFVIYPHALHHLELLQETRFREQVKVPAFRDYLGLRQFEHWRSWRAQPRVPNLPDPTAAATAEGAPTPAVGTPAVMATSTPKPNDQEVGTPRPGRR